MKNKILLFALILVAFISCEKDDPVPGSLNIKVSYFYNNFQGYKPDVGAKAYLHDTKYGNLAYLDSIGPISARVGFLVDKNGKWITADDGGITHKYDGEADVTGTISILNIEPGSYYLVVASEGRYTFSTKRISIGEGENLDLVKNFYYLHDFDYGGESW